MNFFLNQKNINASAKFNFEKNCKNIKIISNRYLQALCEGIDSSIDLNNCLANNEGVLTHQKNGLFSKNCSRCKINYPYWENKIQPVNLECECYNKNIKEKKTNINLEDFLEFNNELKCKDFKIYKKYSNYTKPKPIDTNCILGKITEENTFFSVCDKLNIINFDYENCIFNNNGVFEIGKSKKNKKTNFSRTCFNCNLQKINENYFLECNCLNSFNSLRKEFKPINEFLKYENNDVKCINDSINILNQGKSSSNLTEIQNLIKKFK